MIANMQLGTKETFEVWFCSNQDSIWRIIMTTDTGDRANAFIEENRNKFNGEFEMIRQTVLRQRIM